MARPSIVTACLVCVLQAATYGLNTQPPDYSSSQPVVSPSQPSADELRKQALDLAYNLDHAEAMELLRRSIALAPNDPAPHRALAAVLWLHMLFQKGAVTVDHYLGSFNRARVAMAKPSPDLDAEFRKHVRVAIDLARERVRTSPRDAQAHYDLGAALGLDASYIATVEGKLLAGFKAARRCYDEHERTLELDENRTDAALAVGTYRYVVSTLSLPMRMMAYAAGFGGGKERGISLIQVAAAGNGEARTDALFALILVYNRERQFDDALDVLQSLRARYPRNRLVVLEQGSTALRAGRAAEADRILTDGLRMLANDTRPRMPGEEALWRYKRGTARAMLARADATDDLNAAVSPDAQAWVAGRARVELAKLALRSGDRAGAASHAKQAETLCQNGNDPVCVEEARKLLRNNGR